MATHLPAGLLPWNREFPTREEQIRRVMVKVLDPSTLPADETICLLCRQSYSEEATGDEADKYLYHSAVRTSCGHVVGSQCLWKWLYDQNKNTCPFDRKTLIYTTAYIDTSSDDESLLDLLLDEWDQEPESLPHHENVAPVQMKERRGVRWWWDKVRSFCGARFEWSSVANNSFDDLPAIGPGL